MNDDILKTQWGQWRGDIQEQWGDLTDDELNEIDGDRDRLLGALQERYGYSRERAEADYDEFMHAKANKIQ